MTPPNPNEQPQKYAKSNCDSGKKHTQLHFITFYRGLAFSMLDELSFN